MPGDPAACGEAAQVVSTIPEGNNPFRPDAPSLPPKWENDIPPLFWGPHYAQPAPVPTAADLIKPISSSRRWVQDAPLNPLVAQDRDPWLSVNLEEGEGTIAYNGRKLNWEESTFGKVEDPTLFQDPDTLYQGKKVEVADDGTTLMVNDVRQIPPDRKGWVDEYSYEEIRNLVPNRRLVAAQGGNDLNLPQRRHRREAMRTMKEFMEMEREASPQAKQLDMLQRMDMRANQMMGEQRNDLHVIPQFERRNLGVQQDLFDAYNQSRPLPPIESTRGLEAGGVITAPDMQQVREPGRVPAQFKLGGYSQPKTDRKPVPSLTPTRDNLHLGEQKHPQTPAGEKDAAGKGLARPHATVEIAPKAQTDWDTRLGEQRQPGQEETQQEQLATAKVGPQATTEIPLKLPSALDTRFGEQIRLDTQAPPVMPATDDRATYDLRKNPALDDAYTHPSGGHGYREQTAQHHSQPSQKPLELPVDPVRQLVLNETARQDVRFLGYRDPETPAAAGRNPGASEHAQPAPAAAQYLPGNQDSLANPSDLQQRQDRSGARRGPQNNPEEEEKVYRGGWNDTLHTWQQALQAFQEDAPARNREASEQGPGSSSSSHGGNSHAMEQSRDGGEVQRQIAQQEDPRRKGEAALSAPRYQPTTTSSEMNPTAPSQQAAPQQFAGRPGQGVHAEQASTQPRWEAAGMHSMARGEDPGSLPQQVEGSGSKQRDPGAHGTPGYGAYPGPRVPGYEHTDTVASAQSVLAEHEGRSTRMAEGGASEQDSLPLQYRPFWEPYASHKSNQTVTAAQEPHPRHAHMAEREDQQQARGPNPRFWEAAMAAAGGKGSGANSQRPGDLQGEEDRAYSASAYSSTRGTAATQSYGARGSGIEGPAAAMNPTLMSRQDEARKRNFKQLQRMFPSLDLVPGDSAAAAEVLQEAERLPPWMITETNPAQNQRLLQETTTRGGDLQPLPAVNPGADGPGIRALLPPATTSTLPRAEGFTVPGNAPVIPPDTERHDLKFNNNPVPFRGAQRMPADYARVPDPTPQARTPHSGQEADQRLVSMPARRTRQQKHEAEAKMARAQTPEGHERYDRPSSRGRGALGRTALFSEGGAAGVSGGIQVAGRDGLGMPALRQDRGGRSSSRLSVRDGSPQPFQQVSSPTHSTRGYIGHMGPEPNPGTTIPTNKK